MAGTLDNRIALVTGAGRGIGRATALHLSAQGAALACVARSGSDLEEVVGSIRNAGGTAIAIPADLGSNVAPAEIAAAVTRSLGLVDIVVNNAASVDPLGATASVNLDAWEAAITLNLISPVRLTLLLLSGMLERGWGRIINISSGVVSNPAAMPRGNAYITSKTALEAHTLGIAAELEGSGVTCNVLRPGTVDTVMQKWIREQPEGMIGKVMRDRFVGLHEGAKLIPPDEPARALTAIVESGMNGQIVDYPTWARDHNPSASLTE